MSATEQDRDRARDLLFPELADEMPHNIARLQFSDESTGQIDRIAQALAEERERAIEPFTALADEMQNQVEFRRAGDQESLVADVRETDLRWLRLAISNAKDPR